MGQLQRASEKAKEAERQQREGIVTLRDEIKRCEAQFSKALPRHLSSERFVRAALTALNTVDKLGQCTIQSVLAGLMQSAQLGLEISDVRGQAYLIARWDKKDQSYKAGFQLGYRGMIDLAARAGITVDWDTIHANDAYDYARGTNAYIEHKPTMADPGEPVAYYAVAHFADNRRPTFVLWSKVRMEMHRDQFASTRSKEDGAIFGPWEEHFDAMATKTVIRRLLDKLPTSAELRQAIVTDAREADPEQATYRHDDPGAAVDVDFIGAIPTTASDTAEAPEPEGT